MERKRGRVHSQLTQLSAKSGLGKVECQIAAFGRGWQSSFFVLKLAFAKRFVGGKRENRLVSADSCHKGKGPLEGKGLPTSW